MDDSKIFMFPDGGTRQTSNDVNSLLPLLMCNGGFGGGNWIWIIFLFFLYPLMRNGGLFGNMGQNCGSCLGPLANMVNNNDGRDLIMQAINGNGSAVQRLATMFGTKADMIQSAICQVNNSVAQVGCKIDSSTGALLNAGTQNTMTLANQLATCCCNLKNVLISMKKGIIVMTMTLSIEIIILMTMKNVITKEKNMGIVSVVVMDVINMKSAP
ncbi:hypothetical protein [Intestinibacter bartlettii]|uniref:hypothetical protein n=1 Tax=Intestinibacter bartlettii TaxID=261299 RepID=UPI0039946A42